MKKANVPKTAAQMPNEKLKDPNLDPELFCACAHSQTRKHFKQALGSRMWAIVKFTSQHDRATLLTANLKIWNVYARLWLAVCSKFKNFIFSIKDLYLYSTNKYYSTSTPYTFIQLQLKLFSSTQIFILIFKLFSPNLGGDGQFLLNRH